MEIQSYGKTIFAKTSAIKVKYFWATVKNSKSIRLFGFASIAWKRSHTKTLKNAQSATNKLVTGSELTVAAAPQASM